MTPNELRTNDEPQRILLEASERIKACYPNGTRVEALIAGKRITGRLHYVGLAEFDLLTDDECMEFSPAVHPHRVLP